MGRVRVGFLAAGALCALGCSAAVEDATTPVQSCLTAFGCFEAVEPAEYDIAFDCRVTEGRALMERCDVSRYDLKCTEEFVTEIEGEQREVALVYYWSEGSEMVCLGVQEKL